jgi:decaprenyl-phosphate phosphoribosyltransferase
VNLLTGLLKAMRPKQWIKNLLVLAVPFAAGTLFDRTVIVACGVAFLSFTMAASAIYLINDVRDVEADRQHPTKAQRPIASGRVPKPVALAAAALLIIGSLLVPFTLASGEVSGDLLNVVAAYLVLQLLYVFYLKTQPVLDLATVASGYVLRAVAGGIAASIFVSPWFLAVTAAGAMFLVSGKRYSEIVQQGQSGNSRQILREYSPEYLRSLWSISAGATIVFYALWAFSIGKHNASAQLSVIPLTLALLRYGRDIDSASTEAPENAVMRDPWVIVLGIVFIGLFTTHVAIG